MTRLELGYGWTPVIADKEPYRYPEKLTKRMRFMYSRPAIYRWCLEKGGEPRRVYIGETEHLIRRLRAFIKPGPILETNLRIQRCILDATAKGCEVGFDILVFRPFTMNGYEIDMDAMDNPHVRKLLETITILTELAMGSVVLNAGKTFEERKREQLWKRIPKMREGEKRRLVNAMVAASGILKVR